MSQQLPKFQQIQYEFSRNLRNPAQNKAPHNIEARRMKVYQELFYNNVENFCRNSFPVLHSITTEEKWHRMVRSFFTEHRAESPYFIDISKEFLKYLGESRQPEADDWPFMLELAHWEWMEIYIVSAKANVLEVAHDRNGDLMNEPVVVSPLAQSLVYEYPVHRIGKSYLPEEPPQQPTFLLISRNRQHKVDFMEGNSMTYRLLEVFIEHAEKGRQVTGKEALEQLIEETQFPNPERLLNGGRQILTSLLERDILLGTA
ncbi:HvfC family RiPP maturation protein [Kangiella shandongensis]|uniref:HvfC family RiPP maturation protein n=1 Tax=Kangiella shandongensis TaxID=2763258 RepID=UPI001CC17EED|nr:putative DNA-binding domain-containing protein [Kangiella shandongensis]